MFALFHPHVENLLEAKGGKTVIKEIRKAIRVSFPLFISWWEKSFFKNTYYNFWCRVDFKLPVNILFNTSAAFDKKKSTNTVIFDISKVIFS